MTQRSKRPVSILWQQDPVARAGPDVEGRAHFADLAIAEREEKALPVGKLDQ